MLSSIIFDNEITPYYLSDKANGLYLLSVVYFVYKPVRKKTIDMNKITVEKRQRKVYCLCFGT